MTFRVLLAAVLLGAGSALAGQTPAPGVARPEVMGPAEANILMQGWSALSRGDLDQASERVAQLNQVTPGSVHAMMLNVEIDLARTGALAALKNYETWLGRRRLDNPAVVRRIARGVLFEVSRLTDSPARIDALDALAADGDPAAQTALIDAAKTGSLADIRLLAARGHPGAINRLVEALKGPVGNKIALVETLVASSSPQAIAPLAAMLKDSRPEHRAAAAEGLGRLGARGHMNALMALLTNPASTMEEQIAAAGALLRMDNNMGLPQLEGWLRSEVPGVRMAAAQALAVRHDQTWLEIVRGLSQDSDSAVRLDAVKLLAPYDPALAVSNAQSLMSDENPSVRDEAVRVFASQLPADFVTLRSLLHSSEPTARAVAAARILELTR
jgi:HEAT repeat protein